MIVVAFICGVGMFVSGVFDLIGTDWGVWKEYRDLPERKAWQRKKGVSEVVLGMSGIVFIFANKDWEIIFLGVIAIAAAIFQGINNRRFYKKDV